MEFLRSMHLTHKALMQRILTLSLLLISTCAFSQDFKEKEIKTTIKEVTVFLKGAQIFETGTASIPAGKTILRITNLSPHMDEKSIQVKSKGDFTILSVNHKYNYLSELKKDDKIDSIRRALNEIDGVFSIQRARLEVLKEKQSLLNENKNLKGQNSGTSLAQLKQAIEFYDVEISRIKDEEIKINKTLETNTKEREKLQQQLKELNEQAASPTSEIEIRVSAEKTVNTTIDITYLVGNAGWYPKYDIRVHDIATPLELTYKAEVFQNTGVDWKNVKLRFSNGDPNQSGVVPELSTWNLNYARNTRLENVLYGMGLSGSIRNVRGVVVADDGSPMPGVNVVVKGTTIGTATDANGAYSLTLPNNASSLVFSFIGMTTQEVPISKPEISLSLQPDVTSLSEVVVTGYGVEGALAGRAPGVQIRGARSAARSVVKAIPTTVIENQTTVEIEVNTPYSIKSNGEKLLVDLRTHDIDALYEYYAIPKLDKDAFLIARIIDWDQYNLLEGEANLYFEDAYVGRSILDAKSLADTLTISLGRDRNIVVGREKNQQFSKKRTIGTNIVETRGFKIVVRNKKSQPIKLTLFDQIPVSVVSDISVNANELSRGQLDAQTGKVTWELTVSPQEQKELNLEYEVKYPRRERVILE